VLQPLDPCLDPPPPCRRESLIVDAVETLRETLRDGHTNVNKDHDRCLRAAEQLLRACEPVLSQHQLHSSQHWKALAEAVRFVFERLLRVDEWGGAVGLINALVPSREAERPRTLRALRTELYNCALARRADQNRRGAGVHVHGARVAVDALKAQCADLDRGLARFGEWLSVQDSAPGVTAAQAHRPSARPTHRDVSCSAAVTRAVKQPRLDRDATGTKPVGAQQHSLGRACSSPDPMRRRRGGCEGGRMQKRCGGVVGDSATATTPKVGTLRARHEAMECEVVILEQDLCAVECEVVILEKDIF